MKVAAETRVKTNTHGKYANALMHHAIAMLQEKLAEREMNPNQLAVGMGLNPGTTYRFMSNQLNASMMLFLQVCNYLKLPPSTVFAEAEKRVREDMDAFLAKAKKSVPVKTGDAAQ